MIEWKEIALRLSLAALFGAIIGLERERKNWAAGLRTHMLVCVGASLVMIVSAYGFSDILGTENIVLDPSRVAAQVISGIGFIGAGTILFLKQGVIRGLTTAAGLWTVAAIGLATGVGMYFAAALATILAIVILWILQPFEKKFSERFKQKHLKITLSGELLSPKIISEIFELHGLEIASCTVDKATRKPVLLFIFNNLSNQDVGALTAKLQKMPDIDEINWEN